VEAPVLPLVELKLLPPPRLKPRRKKNLLLKKKKPMLAWAVVFSVTTKNGKLRTVDCMHEVLSHMCCYSYVIRT